jgi:lipopolysaccharide export system protein LptC
MSSKKDKSLHSGMDRLVRSGPSKSRGGAGYSRFVKVMRIVLPLAALAIFGVMVAWPELDKKVNSQPQPVEVTAENVKNELVNPRFEGVDNNQRPYTITAARAVQSEDDPNIVDLEMPVADMTLKGGQWLAAEAKEGLYDQNDRKLELEGNVFLFYDEGYELTTSRLFVDLRARKVWSEESVQGKGPKGLLEAKGLKADATENTLYLQGPAKLVLFTEVSGF